MTKKGYVPKLLAALVGAILCLCVAAVVFTGTGATTARADELEASMKLSLDTVNEFDTAGYKIEVASEANESATHPYDDADNPYDYVITVTDGTESWWNPRGGKLYFKENSYEAVWNIRTPSGTKVTGGGDYQWNKVCTFTTTDDTISTFAYNKNEKIVYPDLGDRADGGDSGPFKTGETVMTFKFKTSGSANNTCTEHGKNAPCTCWTDGDGQGVVLTGMTLRVLYRVVHVEDKDFTFTEAQLDENGNKNCMWLKYNSGEVRGLSRADETWTKAERKDWINRLQDFFGNIYYLQNYDASAGEPTEAQLEGRDFYSLMTGDGLLQNSLVLQTEVRYDHIEIYKKVRQYDNDVEYGAGDDFAVGDAIFLKQGLMLPGKDGNSEWCIAIEGGSRNVLARNQIFVVEDGDDWGGDEYTLEITLDKSSVALEVGGTETIQATVSAGDFAGTVDLSVTWTSQDEEVATIVADGNTCTITAVGAGETTVTATLSDGTKKTVKVTVLSADQISDFKLNKRTVTLWTEGDNTVTLVPQFTAGSAANKAVTWTSSNEAVAIVDENGVVTAVSEGKATITATPEGAPDLAASCSVSVFAGNNGGNTGGDQSGNTGNENNNNDADTTTTTETKKKKCGSNVAGTSAMAGIVLTLGVTAVLVSRKKKAENK